MHHRQANRSGVQKLLRELLTVMRVHVKGENDTHVPGWSESEIVKPFMPLVSFYTLLSFK